MRSHLLALLAALNVCAFVGAAAASPVAGGTDSAQVVLDPSLTNPQPGDSPATLAARQRLAALITQVQQNQQTYDAAAEAVTAAEAALRAGSRCLRRRPGARGRGPCRTGRDSRAQLRQRHRHRTAVGRRRHQHRSELAARAAGRRPADRRPAGDHHAGRQRHRCHGGRGEGQPGRRRSQGPGSADQAQTALAAAQAARVTATNLVVSAHLSDVRAQAAAARANARTRGPGGGRAQGTDPGDRRRYRGRLSATRRAPPR